RPDGAAAPAAARRAVHGPGAPAGRGSLQRHPHAQGPGHHHPAGRAERLRRAGHRRSRLRPGNRPHRAVGHRPGHDPQRTGACCVPGHVKHREPSIMSKQFASVADLEEKKTTFARLSEHCWSYTAEGDPNTGGVIGDEAVLICDTLATPVMARRLIAEIRKITDKPIKYAVLSHYHAVRVLGASAYRDEGLQEVIASQGTYEMIVERGAQDMQSEY